jgi:hypothetical protein
MKATKSKGVSYPRRAYESRRAYLRAKRAELVVLRRELDWFSFCSDWLPDYPRAIRTCHRLETELKELAKKLRHA